MAPPVAVLDACVLYPIRLCDLFIRLAQENLFSPRWTDAIHDEWLFALLRNDPSLDRGRLERRRDLMNAAVREALVAGYENLIPGLSLPDPDDAHVLAAAVQCRADRIITFNLGDFPEAALAPFQIAAQQPDDFVLELLNRDQAGVRAAVRKQREGLKRPPLTADDLLTGLAACGLIRSAAALRPHESDL